MDPAEEEKILQVSLKLVFEDDPALEKEMRMKRARVERL
jgi:hypothetical protein